MTTCRVLEGLSWTG